MHHAVESNQPTIVKLLIDYGIKIDQLDEVQQMPIHKAIYHGFPVIVKQLIDAGSPLSARDRVVFLAYTLDS